MMSSEKVAERTRPKNRRSSFHRRQDLEALLKRERIAALLLEHHTLAEISKLVGLVPSAVTKHLNIITREGVARLKEPEDAITSRLIGESERIAREGWLAWKRSQEDGEVHVKEVLQKKGKGGEDLPVMARVTERKEKQFGDPRFLAEVNRALEMRARIQGLIKKKVEHSGDIEVTKIIRGFDPDEFLPGTEKT